MHSTMIIIYSGQQQTGNPKLIASELLEMLNQSAAAPIMVQRKRFEPKQVDQNKNDPLETFDKKPLQVCF